MTPSIDKLSQLGASQLEATHTQAEKTSLESQTAAERMYHINTNFNPSSSVTYSSTPTSCNYLTVIAQGGESSRSTGNLIKDWLLEQRANNPLRVG